MEGCTIAGFGFAELPNVENVLKLVNLSFDRHKPKAAPLPDKAPTDGLSTEHHPKP